MKPIFIMIGIALITSFVSSVKGYGSMINDKSIEFEGILIPATLTLEVDNLQEDQAQDALFSFQDEDVYFLGRIRFHRNDGEIKVQAWILGCSEDQLLDSNKELVLGRKESPLGRIKIVKILS